MLVILILGKTKQPNLGRPLVRNNVHHFIYEIIYYFLEKSS